MPCDDLSPFRSTEFTEGTTRSIFRKGSGPAVIVIARSPGSPRSAGLRQEGRRHGMRRCFRICSVNPASTNRGTLAALSDSARTMVPACVNEIRHAFLPGGRPRHRLNLGAGPRRHTVRRQAWAGSGCTSQGGYALAIAADDVLLAPVLSQPSMRALTARQKRSIDISPADLAVVNTGNVARGSSPCWVCGSNPTAWSRRTVRLPARAARATRSPSPSSSRDADASRALLTPALGVDRTPHRRARPGHRAALDQVLDLFAMTADRLSAPSPRAGRQE